MMSKQTRLSRKRKELERANLGLYLNIVGSRPKVTTVDSLRVKEEKRQRLVESMKRSRQNAQLEINSLIKQRQYGTKGKRHSLYKKPCRECKFCKPTIAATETPKSQCDYGQIDSDLRSQHMFAASPAVSHSFNIDIDQVGTSSQRQR